MQEKFYIQTRGYSGDCFLFWRKNRCGYTCNLDDALQVDKQEADSMTADKDRGDKAWPVDVLNIIAHRHVNSEHPFFREMASWGRTEVREKSK